MIKAAFSHWPEDHREQFSSVDHLRKYLQMKAGHYDATKIEIAENALATAIAVEAALKFAGSFSRVRVGISSITIYRPRSIDFQTLPHKDACALFDAVSEAIRDETGTSGDEYLKQTEKAA